MSRVSLVVVDPRIMCTPAQWFLCSQSGAFSVARLYAGHLVGCTQQDVSSFAHVPAFCVARHSFYALLLRSKAVRS